MTKYFSLSKALFKNSFAFIDQGKQKKSRQILGYALFAFIIISLLPSLWGLYQMTTYLLEQLIPMQQEGLLIGLVFQAAGLLIFFLAAFMIPAIFYFSKDIEELLSLPLTPVEIIASKFTVTYLYELLLMVFIISPILLAYMRMVPLSALQIIMMMIVVLTLPLLPLIFAAVLVMLVMWLIPFFKNRDLFNLLSGTIVLVLALWLNFSIGGLESLNENQLVDMIVSGDNSLMNIFKFLFFTYPLGMNAIVYGKLLSFLSYVGLSLLTLAAFLGLSHVAYFKGVLGINETASSRKLLTDKQIQGSSKLQNPFFRYLQKEILLLVRTPVYFLNCVSIQFLMPVLLLATAIGSPSQKEAIMRILASVSFSDPKIISIIFMVALSVGLFLGSMNMISTTAISREGQNLYFMKMIPMDFMMQLHAKAMSGILFSVLGLVITLAIILFFVSLKPLIILGILIFSLISILFINYFGLLVDVIRPKLVWESEQGAVKQNLNALFTFIPAMAINFLIIFLVFKGYFNSWIIVVLLGLGLVIATLVVLRILQKQALSLLMHH